MDNKDNTTQLLIQLIDDGLKRSQQSARAVSMLATQSESTIKNLRRGHMPNVHNWHAICDILGIGYSYFAAGEGADDITADPVNDNWPIYGCVRAGGEVAYDVPLDQPVDAYEESSDVLHRRPASEFIGLRVEGESMWPFYTPGDIVYVRSSSYHNLQELYGVDCICETEDGIYLKKLRPSPNPPRVNLESFNPAFGTMEDCRVMRARPVVWVRKSGQ